MFESVLNGNVLYTLLYYTILINVKLFFPPDFFIFHVLKIFGGNRMVLISENQGKFYGTVLMIEQYN